MLEKLDVVVYDFQGLEEVLCEILGDHDIFEQDVDLLDGVDIVGPQVLEYYYYQLLNYKLLVYVLLLLQTGHHLQEYLALLQYRLVGIPFLNRYLEALSQIALEHSGLFYVNLVKLGLFFFEDLLIELVVDGIPHISHLGQQELDVLVTGAVFHLLKDDVAEYVSHLNIQKAL